MKGYSKQQITKKLNDKNIYTPSQYMKYKYNIPYAKTAAKWNSYMLDNIIKNETYTGTLIQGRTERVSHKNHNKVRTIEADWIITKNH